MTTIISDGIESSSDVKSTVLSLFRSIREKKYYEMNEIYDRISDDNKLKSSNWPSVTDVDESLKDGIGYIYRYLYREMWYRHHLYAPTLSQRLDCCCNYSTLFELLYSHVFHKLPNRWLWDMVDEFVNQFQSYWLYRGIFRELERKQLKRKREQEDNLESKTEQDIYELEELNDEGSCVCKLTEDDISELEPNDGAWCVFKTLNLLERIKKITLIDEILERKKDGIELFTAAKDDDNNCYYYSARPHSNVSKVLGYFTMVGLFRVHCLLGNYQTGLNCLHPIDITSQQGFYARVIDCHIATVFHYGFANLMLHRFVEAICKLNNFLVYVFNIQQKSPQILNKIEKMYALLAICISLCPLFQSIDSNVNSQLMQKYGEKISRMQRYDEESKGLYVDLLSYVWPTFTKIPFAPCSGDPRELFDLRNHDIKNLAQLFPTFFKPYDSSYDQALVNLNKVDAVVDDLMFKQKEQ